MTEWETCYIADRQTRSKVSFTAEVRVCGLGKRRLARTSNAGHHLRSHACTQAGGAVHVRACYEERQRTWLVSRLMYATKV